MHMCVCIYIYTHTQKYRAQESETFMLEVKTTLYTQEHIIHPYIKTIHILAHSHTCP